jgi:hypothetical protein
VYYLRDNLKDVLKIRRCGLKVHYIRDEGLKAHLIRDEI